MHAGNIYFTWPRTMLNVNIYIYAKRMLNKHVYFQSIYCRLKTLTALPWIDLSVSHNAISSLRIKRIFAVVCSTYFKSIGKGFKFTENDARQSMNEMLLSLFGLPVDERELC